jgi:Cu-Zn family superoxide dismutase
MRNLNLYILLIASVGMITFGCEDAVQDKDGDNKKDTPSKESVDLEKSEALEIGNPKNAKSKVIEITLQDKSDSKMSGDITFEEKAGQVMMNAKFKGLIPGTHAIHLHETADCSSEDGKSAGGHWNPTNEKHGRWGDAQGYHKGDIGNFEVDKDGTATVLFETSEWCINCDDTTKNIVGRSVIVHRGKDDFISQPSGDAGKRVGCAEITNYKEN